MARLSSAARTRASSSSPAPVGARCSPTARATGIDVRLNPAATRHAFGSDFTVTLPDGSKREVSIKNNPGRHNMLNATAALTAAYVLGLDTERAAEALSTFEGARRRFTQVGEVRGVTLVDDYGHHPTEVRATLAAAKSLDFQQRRCGFPAASLLASPGALRRLRRRVRRCRHGHSHRRLPRGRDAHPRRHEQDARR